MQINDKVLSNHQINILKIVGENKFISKQFYLTGGTALAGFYIPYRLSEDLDFFSETEVDVSTILSFLVALKGKIGYSSYNYNSSFNRNLFFLEFPEEDTVLKLEFTYFPFPRIDKNKKNTIFGVTVDSVHDIAVNKLFTIYQNPRSRDFMDLYMIQEKFGYKLDDLMSKARAKFDWHVDPIKLGSQFLRALDLKDYPILLAKLDEEKWQIYFTEQAKAFQNQIFK